MFGIYIHRVSFSECNGILSIRFENINTKHEMEHLCEDIISLFVQYSLLVEWNIKQDCSSPVLDIPDCKQN